MTRVTGVMVCAAALALGCSSGNATPLRQPASQPVGTLQLKPDSPELRFVKIEAVRQEAGAPTVLLTGRVAFDENHTQRLASPVDGRVRSVLVQPGDHVAVGQPLVLLSSPAVGQVQADALKAQSDQALAQKALLRADALKPDGAISAKEVAQIEGDLRKAKAEVARTTAQLRALGLSASDPTVTVALRAHVAGVVADRNVLVGQEVRADQATPLLTVTDLDTVWVLADVYEQDLGLVRAGAEVKVRVPAYPAETFPGKVVHVGEIVDATSRTVKLRCVVPNAARKLKPEMFARIEVTGVTGQRLITIPTEAVLMDGDRARVVLAGEGQRFHLRGVEVGPEVGGRVRVIAGLRPEERIVTAGALFLQQEIADH